MRWRGLEGKVQRVRKVCIGGGVFSGVSFNDDLKNSIINKPSGSKQGSALHQKT